MWSVLVRHFLTTLLAFAISSALVAAACSDGADDDRGGQAAASTTTTTTPPEQFTGSDEDFYRVPDPLPPGDPGALIRVQPLGEQDGATSLRVMYHSRDAQDHDRAVTGVITYPNTPAPEGGWPVIAWAHGTTGLTSRCAPSRAGRAAPDFGVDGVRVATDYIGLGPIGERHPYLSGPSEAHSVVDAVRAAGHLSEAHAGQDWLAIGHSQGGHAALFTNELAASYAPELDLLGTVVVAPAAVVDRTFGPSDQIVPRMVGIMALYGAQADHPEVDPDDYIGPEVAANDAVIDEGCLDDIVSAFVGIPEDTFYQTLPLDEEPARSVFLANDPGHVKVASPLLVVYGTADALVVPDRVLYLFDQHCAIGQVTELVEQGDATHETVVFQAGETITRWFDDRLAGEAAPDSCDS